MNPIIDSVRQELKQLGTEENRQSSQRFFKEGVQVYGVKTAAVNSMAKAYCKHLKGQSKAEVFALCETLWQSGYIEESIVACTWTYRLHKQYESEDFVVFEQWVDRYVNNWASCDTFCNHSVGAFLEKYPEHLAALKKWTASENRWMRRAAAVSLIVPARRGLFLQDIFEIADALLSDADDLVQKGYGWMLKSASQVYPEEVFAYLLARKDTMPRTAFRYALEKLPTELRARAMEK